MFRQIFNNIPDVTKNLLIINVLFFLATIVMEGQGVDLVRELGMHTPNSNAFQPYQIITHFFMHGGFTHILFNMIGLIVFGSQLERVWGKKRYLVFYAITALGAAFLHTVVQVYEIHELTGYILPKIQINYDTNTFEVLSISQEEFVSNIENWRSAASISNTPVVGASGALYGLIIGFAMLFPNTELQLLFPPIPIKAKWLALILAAFAVYSGYQNNPGDSMAHFAHLGGMVFGFIMIQIWKRDKSNFY